MEFNPVFWHQTQSTSKRMILGKGSTNRSMIQSLAIFTGYQCLMLTQKASTERSGCSTGCFETSKHVFTVITKARPFELRMSPFGTIKSLSTLASLMSWPSCILIFFMDTLPKTDISPEKWWLEDDPFLSGNPIFRCLQTVSFRCRVVGNLWNQPL